MEVTMIHSFIRLLCFHFLLNILFVATASATTILIINNDGSGEGLNDPTVVTPLPGNSATTLGAQYLNVFEAAANYWEERLDSPVTIRATAQLDLLSCSPSSAILGSAGPISVFGEFLNAPLLGTWYTVAQASSLAGSDLDPTDDDISMQFNNGIGTPNCLSGLSWWLGIDSPAPSGTISFYDTILHELAHGLGFLSLVSQSGFKFFGFDDVFMVNLFDQSKNESWADMSDAERQKSSINTGDVIWSGAQVRQNSGYLTSGKNANNVRMYAPNPYQQGSSISHWDTALVPDELMEPSATPTSNDCSTISAFKDMGWNTKGFGELNFTKSSRTVFETEGSIPISVNRRSICGRTIQEATSVTISSINGSALSGSDYSAVNQTVSWASGETGTKTINVPIVDDGLEEISGETFTLNLSNPTNGASLGDITSVTVTIEDKPNEDACFPISKGAIHCM